MIDSGKEEDKLEQLDNVLNIRYSHSSWASPSGVMLLGGREYNGWSREKIEEDGTTTFGIALNYETL